VRNEALDAGATLGPRSSPASHWPEYAIEAAGLGCFMLSACAFGVGLGHPASPVVHAVGSPFVLRACMGLAMGLTAVALVLSPWGKRSGAHFNPAVTLTFFRLGRVEPVDAAFYVAAQVAGGLAGVAVAAWLFGERLADPAVRYVVTAGAYGSAPAFAAEVAISFGLMTAVLLCADTPALNRYTAFVAGALVATFITFEAPLSGMSMNPARSLASAAHAGWWSAFWIYVTAPPLGMLAAAECRLRLVRGPVGRCAKLHHDNPMRCIFRCAYPGQAAERR
jgi:aquaporin Z